MVDPDWSHHCGDLWRAHVLSEAGLDICDVLGPSPRRPRDWVAMMRRLGVRDMAGVISAVHGTPIPIRQAQRGDIVQIGWAIGVCRGELSEFYGATLVSAGKLARAWRLEAGLYPVADPIVPTLPAESKR